MSYRPITDVWLLTRPKVAYYGAYPAGFLSRARRLLGVGITDPVLHVCGGKVRDYPYSGLGPNDKTVDINPDLAPDFVMDVTKELPEGEWPAILADPPYTEEDAKHYGNADFPSANALLRLCLQHVPVGGKVGMLHYVWPQPPTTAVEVAVVAVGCGRNGRARWYTVFERLM